MGCSNGRHLRRVSQLPDARGPLSRRQTREIKVFWENVKRKFEETARENLVRFFRLHPYFQDHFTHLRHLASEQDMLNSPDFAQQAAAILLVYDDVIENLDKDNASVMHKLEEVARIHAKMEAFHGEYFLYMEESLIEAFREKLWGLFTAREEELFRKLFQWMHAIMRAESDAIEYKLIPGSQLFPLDISVTRR